MVSQALGRCRICARKHKLAIFGSEARQHALLENIDLHLIVSFCIQYKKVSCIQYLIYEFSISTGIEYGVFGLYRKIRGIR